jgi:hypothetical protein
MNSAIARARGLGRRLLPAGPLDLLIQLAILFVAYRAWRYSRGAVDGSAAESIANAHELVAVERWLGAFFEPDVQSWALDVGWAADFANWMYANAHFTGGCLALAFVYFFRRDSYGFVRNMVIAAMAISFLGYWLYPTAPPRFVPELGIIDTIGGTHGVPPPELASDAYYNPFAAVPSMHVGLASLFGWSLALLVRPRALKALLFSYPLVVGFGVVATGNHWWIDGLFGVATTAAAAGVAVLLARLNPSWSFHRRPARPLRWSPWRQPRPEPEASEHAA